MRASQTGEFALACPFFVPTERIENGAWPHPSRLPLGWGWAGQCSAPGHEGTAPSHDELAESCNLGYATKCARVPVERSCDAVRFAVARDRGSHIEVTFVRERQHRPVEHGILEYQVEGAHWASVHQDSRIQRMAECYLESYLRRRTQATAKTIPNGNGNCER